MKKLYYFLFLLFLTASGYAQDNEPEFGKINIEEVNFSTYEKDPEAEAVVLFDTGESYFFDTEGGYDIRFTRTRRIKILKKAGFEYAEISIPYYVDGYGKTEKIASIEAYTYNIENGLLKRKTVDKGAVYEEQINNQWRVKKFVFPDVKEGSVIEYKYVLETPFHFNLPDWTFQDKIPTVYSRYKVGMIPFYEYSYIAQGLSKFDYFNSKKDNTLRKFGTVSEVYGQNVGSGFEFQDLNYTYVMKDVPAFKDEAYITSANDYIMKLDFQLSRFHSPRGGSREIISTWPKLIEGFLKHENFGKYIKSSERLAKKIFGPELDLNGKSELDKAKAIIKYVRAGYSWNGYNGRYASENVKKIFAQKTGNAADINLLLAGLLNAADIDARPVIISTRSHGKIKSDYPFEHFFNYVVVLVKIDDLLFLTDGTEEKIAYNRIPLRCINEKGLLLHEANITWINLEANILSLDHKDIRISIDPKNRTAKTSISLQASEFESFIYKDTYKNDSIKMKELLLKSGFNTVKNITTFNYEKNDRPYVINYEGEVRVENLGNKIIISPFLNFPIKENQLKEKTRTYPVDFIYPKDERFKSLINIPDGYSVVALPENYSLSNELADIHIQYTKTDNVVEAVASYVFKKGVYQPNEYARIKFYLDNIVKKFNEQIVLDKI